MSSQSEAIEPLCDEYNSRKVSTIFVSDFRISDESNNEYNSDFFDSKDNNGCSDTFRI